MKISPNAGKPATALDLIDSKALIQAYYDVIPDPAEGEQRVIFGTSGHRGSSLKGKFNERHILAITQAICEYRKEHKIDGPLFLGIDTHALSKPASETAIEVLSANGVETVLESKGDFTPTPVISHAILSYNRQRRGGLADGIVVTPSHNPPEEGGFKYNPPHGGPADTEITQWIETRANQLLLQIDQIKRVGIGQKIRRADFLNDYVNDLIDVIDMEAIRSARLRIGVDPLGGAGIHYWGPIADRYGLDLTVVNKKIDPTFSFMTLDWDGKIRMDPSSSYAMEGLIALRGDYDIAFACDTDHDRHGIVTKSVGLMPPNHYLSASIFYLFMHRTGWGNGKSIGKTAVSSEMIDRIAHDLNKKIYEVPVGFKWFVEGLYEGTLGFAGEESAGSSFLRKGGSAWTTDKDGIIAALLSAEMTAVMGKDPGEIFKDLSNRFGKPYAERIDAQATASQKQRLKKLSSSDLRTQTLAGEKIESILTQALGNGAPLGGIKVKTKNGWFAARPSGTEDIYKIYAESFKSSEHLQEILKEAQTLVDKALGDLSG